MNISFLAIAPPSHFAWSVSPSLTATPLYRRRMLAIVYSTLLQIGSEDRDCSIALADRWAFSGDRYRRAACESVGLPGRATSRGWKIPAHARRSVHDCRHR